MQVIDSVKEGIQKISMSSSGSSTETMKAVNYQGAFKVKVEEVPMPKLEHPDDIIVKVTTAGKPLFELLEIARWEELVGVARTMMSRGRIENRKLTWNDTRGFE